jgi:hypothetical protein
VPLRLQARLPALNARPFRWLSLGQTPAAQHAGTALALRTCRHRPGSQPPPSRPSSGSRRESAESAICGTCTANSKFRNGSPLKRDGALGPSRAIRPPTRLFHPQPHAPDAPSQRQQPGALDVLQQPGAAWQAPFEARGAIRGTQNAASLACGGHAKAMPRRHRRRSDALLSRRLVPGATRADGAGEGC